jgi:glycosyltransferase involved in cell wall biosynthesis
MRVLESSCQDVDLFFMGDSSLYKVSYCSDSPNMQFSATPAVDFKGDRKAVLARQISELKKLQPVVIQASDIREIARTIIFQRSTGARIIYDSHEDYFNQIFEYSGKTLRSLVSAVRFAIIEIALLRFFETIFCTDEFLLEKYNRPIYGCRNVELLRNFPPREMVTKRPAYPRKNKLNLVYIGSVNPYRGVVECAEYVDRFNEKYSPSHILTLTVYSSSNSIVEALVKQDKIRHLSWIDYVELMKELPRYDVGICLWNRLKKFEHNLPLKNFDYMAAGLPIITSNFGNLEKYARLSGGAICIDPLEYAAFEAAIVSLFDPSLRQRLGEAGRSFILKQATFESEASNYVRIMTG